MLQLQQIVSLSYVKWAGEDWILVELNVTWKIKTDLNLGMKWMNLVEAVLINLTHF